VLDSLKENKTFKAQILHLQFDIEADNWTKGTYFNFVSKE